MTRSKSLLNAEHSRVNIRYLHRYGDGAGIQRGDAPILPGCAYDR